MSLQVRRSVVYVSSETNQELIPKAAQHMSWLMWIELRSVKDERKIDNIGEAKGVFGILQRQDFVLKGGLEHN